QLPQSSRCGRPSKSSGATARLWTSPKLLGLECRCCNTKLPSAISMAARMPRTNCSQGSKLHAIALQGSGVQVATASISELHSSMHALRFDKTGSLDALKVSDIPKPVPAPNEALVEIKAAAVNPSDIKNVLGGMHETTVPRTPGRDFAGTVVAGPPQFLGQSV